MQVIILTAKLPELALLVDQLIKVINSIPRFLFLKLLRLAFASFSRDQFL